MSKMLAPPTFENIICIFTNFGKYEIHFPNFQDTRYITKTFFSQNLDYVTENKLGSGGDKFLKISVSAIAFNHIGPGPFEHIKILGRGGEGNANMQIRNK